MERSKCSLGMRCDKKKKTHLRDVGECLKEPDEVIRFWLLWQDDPKSTFLGYTAQVGVLKEQLKFVSKLSGFSGKFCFV